MHGTLDSFKIVSSEATRVSENTIVLAPGQGKIPASISYNEHCEELAFPHISPSGEFGYRVKRQVTVSPFRYFDQCLLNFVQYFASDADYYIFVSSAVEQSRLKSSINIALHNARVTELIAGLLFYFMSAVKGTPAYRKQFYWSL